MAGHVAVNQNTHKITISKFGSYFSKNRNKMVPGGKPTDTDFYTEMCNIKNGTYRQIIEQLKSIKDTNEQKRFKESKLPSFTISCQCKDWREEKNITQHSGLINIDIDGDQNQHIDDWGEMRDRICDKLNTIVACFLSARGNGLSFVVKIDPAKHRQTYDSIGYDLQKHLNIYIDPSCKNPTRLRFVSYDPDAYINFDFEGIPVVHPSAEYLQTIRSLPALSLTKVTKADSPELFNNAVQFTENRYHAGRRLEFVQGMKYWYLITLAGYCNSHGMSYEYCQERVNDRYGPLTNADIEAPVKGIYTSYQHQHGAVPMNEDEADLLRDKLRIDINEQLQPPPTVLEVFQGGEHLRFATLGNFSMITGKAKSRKTFFISLIAAAFLKRGIFMDKLVRAPTPGKERIIIFDTEQGKYDVQQLAKRIMRLTGLTQSDCIEVYHLRTLDTNQRIDFIHNVLYSTDDVALAVIDGIRDLVFDINEPHEATKTATNLLRWSEERDIHIITVLHQNKNDSNSRGHLGTELTNKAESVLSIAKQENNPELSIVKPEYFRGKEFSEFAFKIGEDGLPFILDDFKGEQEEKAGLRSILPHKLPDASHMQALREIFQLETRPKYADMITQIKLSFQAFGINFGMNKAKEFFTYYKNQGWVVENSDRLEGEKSTTYRLNQLV